MITAHMFVLENHGYITCVLPRGSSKTLSDDVHVEVVTVGADLRKDGGECAHSKRDTKKGCGGGISVGVKIAAQRGFEHG